MYLPADLGGRVAEEFTSSFELVEREGTEEATRGVCGQFFKEPLTVVRLQLFDDETDLLSRQRTDKFFLLIDGEVRKHHRDSVFGEHSKDNRFGFWWKVDDEFGNVGSLKRSDCDSKLIPRLAADHVSDLGLDEVADRANSCITAVSVLSRTLPA